MTNVLAFHTALRAKKVLEAQARTAALKLGYRATKTRWRAGSRDNQGGFAIVDDTGLVVAGRDWTMSAEDVIEWCKGRRQ